MIAARWWVLRAAALSAMGLPGYDGEIYAVYVLAQHQRRGIGRQLMGVSARHLMDQGFGAAMLWALEANGRARAFYEALGGQLIGRKTKDIADTPQIEVAYGWPDLTMLVKRRQVDHRILNILEQIMTPTEAVSSAPQRDRSPLHLERNQCLPLRRGVGSRVRPCRRRSARFAAVRRSSGRWPGNPGGCPGCDARR